MSQATASAALYVTHDLAVVAALADRVAVMYAGRFIEEGLRGTLREPVHPYTRQLIQSTPKLEARTSLVASPARAATRGIARRGCRFAPRCDYAIPCLHRVPPPALEARPDNAHSLRPRRRAHRPRRDAAAAAATRGGGHRGRTPDRVALDAFYGSSQVLHDVIARAACARVPRARRRVGRGKTTLGRVPQRPPSGGPRRDPLPRRGARRGTHGRSRDSAGHPVRLPEPLRLEPSPPDRRLVAVPLSFFGLGGATADAAGRRAA